MGKIRLKMAKMRLKISKMKLFICNLNRHLPSKAIFKGPPTQNGHFGNAHACMDTHAGSACVRTYTTGRAEYAEAVLALGN